MTNGKWLAQTPSQIGSGQWFHPLVQTEQNVTLDPFDGGGLVVVWTGSATDHCSNWNTLNSVGTVKGLLEWGSIGKPGEVVSCNLEYRLACFERGHNETRVAPAITKKLAFVSQAKWRPERAGRASADALCTSEAQLAGYGGAFIALLPSATQTSLSRVSPTAVFQRADGELLGSVTSLSTFMMLDATGLPATGTTWTGGYPDQLTASTCQDWRTNGGSAVTGVAGALGPAGYNGYFDPPVQQSCNIASHLYCLEQ